MGTTEYVSCKESFTNAADRKVHQAKCQKGLFVPKRGKPQKNSNMDEEDLPSRKAKVLASKKMRERSESDDDHLVSNSKRRKLSPKPPTCNTVYQERKSSSNK